MRFISIDNWSVILKEWDKLMIPRENYLGIKWELIHNEMVFETIELCWNFQDEIILG
jgi:hypothetical protein